MKLQLPRVGWAGLPDRIRGMFNLNDSRWGRGDDKPADASKPEAPGPGEPPTPPPQANNGRGRGQGPNQGPPDLDELWRDFNRKLGGIFGGSKNSGRGSNGSGGGNGGGFKPDM